MAILNRFLQLLELIETLAAGLNFLTTLQGIAVSSCLWSYMAFLFIGCDAPTASILAGSVALTLHSVLRRPDF
jgi:hypothetical protein